MSKLLKCNLSDIFHEAFGGAWSQEEEDFLFKCEHALKLQELVKDRIKIIKDGNLSMAYLTLNELQSLIEESEK